jgi:ATP-dependent Clp protease protease subunit
MAKGFFKIQNAGANKITININGIIGDWGNSSEDVVWQIESQTADEIEVFIQSPGGSAFEAIAMYNALRLHPAKVTTYVLGAAASAGSIVFMAGDVRVMPVNTYLMIHEPALNINGKASQLRTAADFLDSMTTALVSTYLPHVTIDADKILELIVAETWIKAIDAQDMGFATKIDHDMQVAALSHDFENTFENLPKALTQQPISGVIENIKNIQDFERTLRESGCSKALATALVSKAKELLLSESVSDTEAIFNSINNFKLLG